MKTDRQRRPLQYVRFVEPYTLVVSKDEREPMGNGILPPARRHTASCQMTRLMSACCVIGQRNEKCAAVWTRGLLEVACRSTDCATENGGTGRGDFVQLKKKHVPGKVRREMEGNWELSAGRRAKRRNF